MNLSQIPEKPLVAGVGKVEGSQRIYFFERPDGTRLFVPAREAWSLYTKPQQTLGQYPRPFKFLGSSDGTLYQKAVMECQQIFRETGDLAKAQERLKLGEEEEFNSKQMVLPPNAEIS